MYPVASPSQGNVIMMMLMNCSNKLPAASLFLFGRVPVFFEHVSCHEVLQESLASQSGSEPEPGVTKLQNGSVRRIRKPPKEFCLIQANPGRMVSIFGSIGIFESMWGNLKENMTLHELRHMEILDTV